MPKRADSIVLLPGARSKGVHAFDFALTLTLELPRSASWDARTTALGLSAPGVSAWPRSKFNPRAEFCTAELLPALLGTHAHLTSEV
jgi:hypothetical protein